MTEVQTVGSPRDSFREIRTGGSLLRSDARDVMTLLYTDDMKGRNHNDGIDEEIPVFEHG